MKKINILKLKLNVLKFFGLKILLISILKKLAIKKWEYIINQRNGQECSEIIEFTYPELALFKNYAYCSFCFIYTNQKNNNHDCVGCPLSKLTKFDAKFYKCQNNDHPFGRWQAEKTIKNAKAVLNAIKSI